MVNNHGDRKSPKDRVIPLPNGRFMAYKWGLLSTYTSHGMILQVVGVQPQHFGLKGITNWLRPRPQLCNFYVRGMLRKEVG